MGAGTRREGTGDFMRTIPPFDGDDEAEIQVPLIVGVSL